MLCGFSKMVSDCGCKLLMVLLQLCTCTLALCQVRSSYNHISRTCRFEGRGKSRDWFNAAGGSWRYDTSRGESSDRELILGKLCVPNALRRAVLAGVRLPLKHPRDARGGQDPWQGWRVREMSLLMCDLQNVVVILKNAVSKRSWPDWREGAN